MRDERRAIFCGQLKAAREKSGVSLEQLAASTKISRSLFVGLERNDLSRWPKGLYRRAYLREYLRAIDLTVDPMVEEFVRLFPDEEAAHGPVAAVPGAACTLPMTLAEGQVEALARARIRIGVAAIDLAIVAVMWAMAGWAIGADLRTIGLVVALGYYTIATAWRGRSVGSQLLEPRRWRLVGSRTPPQDPDTLLSRLDSMATLGDPPGPIATES